MKQLLLVLLLIATTAISCPQYMRKASMELPHIQRTYEQPAEHYSLAQFRYLYSPWHKDLSQYVTQEITVVEAGWSDPHGAPLPSPLSVLLLCATIVSIKKLTVRGHH